MTTANDNSTVMDLIERINTEYQLQLDSAEPDLDLQAKNIILKNWNEALQKSLGDLCGELMDLEEVVNSKYSSISDRLMANKETFSQLKENTAIVNGSLAEIRAKFREIGWDSGDGLQQGEPEDQVRETSILELLGKIDSNLKLFIEYKEEPKSLVTDVQELLSSMKQLIEEGIFDETLLVDLKEKHSNIALQLQNVEISNGVSTVLNGLEVEISRIITKMSQIAEANHEKIESFNSRKQEWENDKEELKELKLTLEGLFQIFLAKADLNEESDLELRETYKVDNAMAIESIVQKICENQAIEIDSLKTELTAATVSLEQKTIESDGLKAEMAQLTDENNRLKDEVNSAKMEITNIQVSAQETEHLKSFMDSIKLELMQLLLNHQSSTDESIASSLTDLDAMSLSSLVSALKCEISAKDEVLKSKKVSIEQLRTELSECQRKLSRFEDESVTLNRTVQQLGEEVREANEAKHKFEVQANENHSMVIDMQTRLESEKTVCEKLKEEVSRICRA